MLSPPYSPHAVMMEELNQENGKKSTAPGAQSVRTTQTVSTAPTIERNSPAPSNPDTASPDSANSDSATVAGPQSSDTSGDEFGDYDFKSSFAKSRQAKRQSSEAFADDETVFDDDDVMSVKSAGSPPSVTRHGSLGGRERRMTTCWDALKVNPAKYLRQERSFLELYPLRRHSWAGPGVSGINSEDQQDGSSGISGSMGGRGGSAGHSSSYNGSSNGGAGRKRTNRAHQGFGAGRGRKRASVIDISHDAVGDNEDGSGSHSSSSRSSPSSASQVRVHDLSLNQIEDYAPPLSSLPPGKSLRAEWKGAPMDLSNDPDLHLLHPAEAHLASVLRLPCEVYLDSKRRLFAEKVHRLKQGLPFRRTDSQKACRIDVNKASRLFGAFEKIGWLSDELFTEHMP